MAPTINEDTLPWYINSADPTTPRTFNITVNAANPVSYELSGIVDASDQSSTKVAATISASGLISVTSTYGTEGMFYTTIKVTDTVTGLSATQKFRIPVAFAGGS